MASLTSSETQILQMNSAERDVKRMNIPSRRVQRAWQNVASVVFGLCAAMSVFALLLICFFLFANGIPALNEIGWWHFLSSATWKPSSGEFGIAAFIAGTFVTTLGALVVAVPVSVLTAIFISSFASPRIRGMFIPLIELLAEIPSVVYGFFGLILLVPFIRTTFGVQGMSILAAVIVLAIMIAPTIISTSISALDAVPHAYREGAIALGATKERAEFTAVLPAAKSGVISGIILGMGRALGETMAVIMVIGNQPLMPDSLLHGARTMTTNVVLEMGYAADLHRGALLGTAVILFIIELIVNLILAGIRKKL
ncbi:phosphate ABC transporter permease subunit PstC [Alloscardovia criceti]|uniref:phosphate ABC transporter permease subunit PstC n=1 Tax=Alloscardovia criceti TaxID=356828 RepID=UPI00036AC6DC|nr:phosphate ABC transporter permease subunit PstC [Alloscardovia criceti]